MVRFKVLHYSKLHKARHKISNDVVKYDIFTFFHFLKTGVFHHPRVLNFISICWI